MGEAQGEAQGETVSALAMQATLAFSGYYYPERTNTKKSNSYKGETNVPYGYTNCTKSENRTDRVPKFSRSVDTLLF